MPEAFRDAPIDSLEKPQPGAADDPIEPIRDLRRAGRLAEAEASISQMLARHPRGPMVLIEAAAVAYESEDWSTALARYEALLELLGRKCGLRMHQRIAECAIRLDHLGHARQRLRASRTKFPADETLLSMKVKLDLAQGDGARALDSLIPWIEATGVKRHRRHAKFYGILFRSGFAREAYDLKTHCAQVYSASLARRLHSRERLERALAHGFLGEFDEARARLLEGGYSTWRRNVALAEQHLGYWDIMLGSPPLEVARRLFEAEDADPANEPTTPGHWSREDFRRYFHGRSIAVVGPADTRQHLRAEIEGFDIVVRTNVFSASDLEHSAEHLGVRADVSYYVNATFARRRGELYAFVKSSGMIPVLRRPLNLLQAREQGGLERVRLCSATPAPFLAEYPSLHAIPRIIWDLMKFGPSRIKLFNVTFYAGSMYAPGYRPNRKAPALTSLGTQHDPLQGFIFTKNLLSRGVIECDPVATEILDWSAERYISMLQTEYAEHWKRPRG